MNEVDKQLQNQIDSIILDVKNHTKMFTDHIIDRAKHDTEVAVSLENIKNTTTSILKEVQKTNGRVNGHDSIIDDIRPKVEVLFAAHSAQVSDQKTLRGKWLDYLIKVGLVILGIVLTRLDIINFNLPL